LPFLQNESPAWARKPSKKKRERSRKQIMGTFFRAIAISTELAVLTVSVYVLLAVVKLALFDFGLHQKYRSFIEFVVIMLGCLALVFLVSHLIAFYPRVSP